MPLMEIIRNPEPTRLVRMGHAPEVIQPEPKDAGKSIEDLTESLTTFQQSIERATIDSPPVVEPAKNKRGRPAKMANDKDKDLDEVGTKTIRKDDPGEQGAIGTHGANAPAQEKVPETPQGSEKEGD